MDDEPSTKKTKTFSSSRYSLCICCTFFIAIGIGIGMLIGRYSLCHDKKTGDKMEKWNESVSPYLLKDGDSTIGDELISNISADNIRTYLK